MNHEFYTIIEEICDKDPRYKQESYEFVMEALSYAQKRLSRAKHVSGMELLEGIKELLLERFGPMTMPVLKCWGIQTTQDFGNIVFNLVQNKILNQNEEDSFEIFKNGYNFEEVFERGYRKRLARKISRMR